MRIPALLLATSAALLAACGSAPPDDDLMPGPLRELTLLEGHPTMPPVVFDHAFHASSRAMGRPVSCADCHHPLREDPRLVPAACTSCHPYLYLQPPVDESLPHEHRGPPDL